jgi:hypothetical protein
VPLKSQFPAVSMAFYGAVFFPRILRTNAELGKMVEDLTGRRPPPRTSKATLVNRIERASLGDKRKSSTAQVSEKAPKRGAATRKGGYMMVIDGTPMPGCIGISDPCRKSTSCGI